VHAVIIENGFWAQRREVNVSKSILPWVNCWKPTADRQFPPPHRKEHRGAARAGVFRFRRLQVDGGRQLCSAIRRAFRAPRCCRQHCEGHDCRTAADGYLNTYYNRRACLSTNGPKVQQWGHELYNMGHFLQGATAYYRATGDRALLDAGIRFVK